VARRDERVKPFGTPDTRSVPNIPDPPLNCRDCPPHATAERCRLPSSSRRPSQRLNRFKELFEAPRVHGDDLRFSGELFDRSKDFRVACSADAAELLGDDKIRFQPLQELDVYLIVVLSSLPNCRNRLVNPSAG
jgi:hypothetical protein